MAELPDLQTDQISYIAYWNVEDQGGINNDQWGPDEVTSDTNIESQTLYDNGIEGEYNLANGRTGTWRVKNDGWFIVYLDRELNNVGPSVNGAARGTFDIINDHTDYNSASDLRNHTLERAIYNLQSQLENSPAVSYNTSDVGLFSYVFPLATTATLLSAYENGSNGSYTVGLQYTDDTELYRHWVVASGFGDRPINVYDGGSVEISFNGNLVVDVPEGGGLTGGAINDNLYDLSPDSGVEYNGLINFTSTPNGRTGRGSIHNLLTWG